MPRRKPIRVNVIRRGDRGKYVLRWNDPKTGKPRERWTTATRRREAEREAADLLRNIIEGQLLDTIGWMAFRRRYEEEKLPALKPKTRAAWKTAANRLEDLYSPTYLEDVDAGMLSRFQAAILSRDLSIQTVASYIRSLKAALSWAVTIYPGYRVPQFRPPKLPKSKIMRGRPITTEEFERMLAATPGIVGDRFARSWRRLQRGLWLSGLRLGESLKISWDEDQPISIFKIDSRRPKLLIQEGEQKSGRGELMAITPDFAAFLRRVPREKRYGPVFSPRLSRGIVHSVDTASHTISEIGRAASVVVDRKGEKTKYATAHDLRRSFGARWAPHVMPVILKELMRHRSIDTTMRYYVGQDADRTAAEVWRVFSDLSGDLTPNGKHSKIPKF